MAPAEAVRMDQDMKQCIQECLSCHRICLETLTQCLQKGGRHVEAKHLRLMMDCTQICQTSADFMLRGSDLHTRTCFACAEVCSACAESCEKMADDAQMKACADACRRCAESCRRMSASIMQGPNAEASQRAPTLPA
jgi:hypothetical protein